MSSSTLKQQRNKPTGSYIIKIKSGADAKELKEDIKKQGGEIEDDQSGSTFLPRITAKLPESFASSLNNTLQAGDHKVIEYIEPNGEIKVSPLPGNLPNPPKRD
ncbi:hypothetical protein NCC49_006498 [Naganishia albida]|nr:hypothetical protein NCC49_006498 [Naganishia albida]